MPDNSHFKPYTSNFNYPKKLIEVALPLDDINAAAAREKSIRHGHPSTLHLWWARRPLAAARAVIFAQMVNDPGYLLEERGQLWVSQERERLFEIIRELVKWENTTNERVLEMARHEIRQSWKETCRITGEGDPDKLPPFYDPFCGGGSIPLEAQRLGFEAHGSDLNPVAVMITKALIEIPPKFAGQLPVNPEWRKKNKGIEAQQKKLFKGAMGLAEDVRYYGEWMREKAWDRIGHLYPTVNITAEMVAERPDLKQYEGQDLTVIAWLWARTVESSNPAYKGCHVPLVSSFMLSTKKGKEAFVEPVIHKDGKSYEFVVKNGKPNNIETAKSGTKASRGANFTCLLSGEPLTPDYLKAEGMARRLGSKLMAVVLEGSNGRVYISPTKEYEDIACSAQPTWEPLEKLNYDRRAIWCPLYGLEQYKDLFTKRQLVALTTFSDLVAEAREQVKRDYLGAQASSLLDIKNAGGTPALPGQPLNEGGTGAQAYADAVATYLAFGVDRSADFWSSLCTWANQAKNELVAHVFGRQALPMVWDFAEANPFSNSGGNIEKNLQFILKALNNLSYNVKQGIVKQYDVSKYDGKENHRIISSDPPYYDNIGYADLSDFFYVWMRRSLKEIYPDLFSTMLVPKAPELIASSYRHGGKDAAEEFFHKGMINALTNMRNNSVSVIPTTIYYAFKQAEIEEDGIASAGWSTFLQAAIISGYSISGTWPVRTERFQGLKSGVNALASSVILVCRKRPEDAPSITRGQFIRELDEELPEALHVMMGNSVGRTPIAPVDLAQASIGPGMGIFSKYSKVLEADGTPMSVRTALQLINKAIDEYLYQAESDLDAETRFCTAWFAQYSYDAAPFGEAEVLTKGKGSSVDTVKHAGVLEAHGGKVRLLRREELPAEYDPSGDSHIIIWETTQHLIKRLDAKGEIGAAELVRAIGEDRATESRALAYRLFQICDQKKWAEEARAYNGLVIAWPSIIKLASKDDSELF